MGSRPPQAAGTAQELELPPLRVLLVEDSQVNQKLARVLLEKRGHHVDVANHGREALDKLKLGHFDLVLMDVQMPEMDGLEAAKIIRAGELLTGHHLPIVALTAHAVKGDRQRCLDVGMDGYVAKPLRPKELFSAVSLALRGASVRASATHTAPTEAATKQSGSDAGGRSSRVPAPQGGPIDWSTALETAYHDEQLLADLTGLFLDQLPRYLSELDESHGRGDTMTVERVAHTLKGQFRIFGACAAADYALEIETRARSGDLGTGHLLTSLQRECDRVRDAMLAFTGANRH